MKRLAQLAALAGAALLFVFAPAPASALDCPHCPGDPDGEGGEFGDAVCMTCHIGHTTFGTLLDGAHGESVNNLCESCHTAAGPGTEVHTHGATANDCSFCRFDFELQCDACHGAHGHQQPYFDPGDPGGPDMFLRTELRKPLAGASCNTACPGGEHPDQATGACVADAVCGAGSCGAGQAACDDSTGQIVCTCPVNFAGPGCDSCASGYTGYPACSPVACATAATSCANGHGTCNENGVGDCNIACTGGQYNDPKNAGQCTTPATCPGSCLPTEDCSDANGEEVCTCPVGFTGALCNACAPGFSGYPSCVATPCAANGNPCGYGTCAGGGVSCDTACPGGEHNDPATGTCVADVACPGACVNQETCDDSHGLAVCNCPLGYAGAACDSCASGYSGYPSCTPVVGCSAAAQPCGSGTCSASCGGECPVDQHNDQTTGECVADEQCTGQCENGGTCAVSHGVAICTCPANTKGPTCSLCVDGYSGTNCATVAPCVTENDPCGHGTCVSLGGGDEFQICSDQNSAQGGSCTGTTCSSTGRTATSQVGGSCINRNATVTLTHNFVTASADDTPFMLWIRLYDDGGWEAGEQVDCSLTNATSGVVNFSFTGDGLGTTTYGAPCSGLTKDVCWAAANDNSAIALKQGPHALTCTVTTDSNAEMGGFDGLIYTTALSYVPDAGGPACNDDAIFTDGACFGNWGPNASGGGGGGLTCSCPAGYVDPGCAQCDTDYVAYNGVCVPASNDPCSGVSCDGRGTCFVDWDGLATCDCTEQYFGTARDNCAALCGVGSGYTCSCPVGYAAPDCSACETDYVEVDGACVAAPCASNPCNNGGVCYVDPAQPSDWACDGPGRYYGPTCDSCDVGGAFTCEGCAAGYTGASCDTCAAGYVASGGECIDDPCDPSPCGGGGVCYVDSAGLAACDCPGQWYGSACDQCAAPGPLECICATGYGPDDDCSVCQVGYHEEGGACVADSVGVCSGQGCTGHGTCVVDDGAALCVCSGRYFDASCGSCDAPGGEWGFELVAVSVTSPADLADGNPTQLGVCEGCHTQTTHHTNAADDLEHNAGTDCTTCHRHTGATDASATSGFVPAEGAKRCWECHYSPAGGGQDVTSYGWEGAKTLQDQAEWLSVGHGASGAYASGTPGAAFDGQADHGCAYCHDEAVHHNAPGNYMRLIDHGLGEGWNDVCLVCHHSANTGYDPGTGYLKLNGAKNVDDGANPDNVENHQGGKHSPGSPANHNGGQFCWDCHDPHGDLGASGNPLWYMLQKEPVEHRDANMKPTAVAAAIDFDPTVADNTGALDYNDYIDGGLCVGCHDGALVADPDVSHYTKVLDDNHGSTPGDSANDRCTDCHRHNNGFFGVASDPCHSCHLLTQPDAPSYVADGTESVLSETEWLETGHGRSTASGAYPSGNPAANFDGALDRGCAYCHDTTQSHQPAGNWFMLANNGWGSWGKNGTCQVCHATGSPGYDGAGELTTSNGTTKIAAAHYGTDHAESDPAHNGGKQCWDCHDPHGDRDAGNQPLWYMMQQQPFEHTDGEGVPTTFAAAIVFRDVNANGLDRRDYVDTAAGAGKGLCNNCHDDTDDVLFHYKGYSDPGHFTQSTGKCTDCHLHDDDFGATATCAECHLGTGDVVSWATDAVMARLDTTQWTDSGHGRMADTYASNNLPGGFDGLTDKGCGYCHDASLAALADHNPTGNWLMLLNRTWNSHADNGTCMICHEAGSPGISGVNGTTKVAAAHYGADHGDGNPPHNGGARCWDCHDPHGDAGADGQTLWYMMQNQLWEHVTPGSQVPAVETAAINFRDFDSDGLDRRDFTDVKAGANRGLCNNCHDATDGVQFHTKGSSDTGHYSQASGKCTDCHGHGDNFAGSGTCATCHLGTGDTVSWATDGSQAVLDSAQWLDSGHGRDAASTYASGTVGADFVNLADNGCEYCHDASFNDLAAHNPSGNFLMLLNRTWNSHTDNGTCMVCHEKDAATGVAGVTATKLVAAGHYGGDHGEGNPPHNGGARCWDCHDPHGDVGFDGQTLWYMMQNRPWEHVAPGSQVPAVETAAINFRDMTAPGDVVKSDFVDTGAGVGRGLCNNCHDATDNVDYYTKGASDTGHNSGSSGRCTDCHAHDDGFAGAGSCTDCHGAETGAGVLASHRRNAMADFTGARSGHPSYTKYDCVLCHLEGTASAGIAAPHANGVVDLRDVDKALLTYIYDDDDPSTRAPKPVVLGPNSGFDCPSGPNDEYRNSLTFFCQGCHDADGFFDEGFLLAVMAAEDLDPDIVTTPTRTKSDPFGDGSTPLNIASKFNTATMNATHSLSCVKVGYKASGGEPDYVSGVKTSSDIDRIKPGAFANGWEEPSRPTPGPSDPPQPRTECADCHLPSGGTATAEWTNNAHGAPSTKWLLDDATGGPGTPGSETISGTGFVDDNTLSTNVTCMRCHNVGSYTGGGTSAELLLTRAVVHKRSDHVDAAISLFEFSCINCHGGDAQAPGAPFSAVERGQIHGTSKPLPVDHGQCGGCPAGEVCEKTGRTTYACVPTMNEGYMFITGAALTHWNGLGLDAATDVTCYDGKFAPNGANLNCNQHGSDYGYKRQYGANWE